LEQDTNPRVRHFHRHEVLHLPHSRKNKHILTGYRAYRSPAHAFRDLFTLHNETSNIVTALLGLFTTISLTSLASSHEDLLDAWHWRLLHVYGWACGLNAVLVALYHLLCPYPQWYGLASAMDLWAITLIALAAQAISHFVPGGSAFAGYLDAVDMGAAEPNAAYKFLRYGVGPLVQAATGGGHLDTRVVCYAALTVYVLVIGVTAAVRRIFATTETPLPLLAANFLPVLWNVLDITIAAPRPFTFVSAVFLFTGGALFAAKLPERWLGPRDTTENGTSKADDSRGLQTAALTSVTDAAQLRPNEPAQHGGSALLARLGLPELRLVDIVGHSHMWHHICYTSTLFLCGSDFAFLALRHACTAAAGSRSSDSVLEDARCAPFR